MKIYKYRIDTPSNNDTHEVSMPRGATVLSVDAQGSEMFVWALVDPDNSSGPRRFRIYGTGHEVPFGILDSHEFVGTVHMAANGMRLVFHVFQERG